MKRIGMMTFYDVQNYGAALQAYALQHKLLEFGTDAEFIRFIDDSQKVNQKAAGIRDYFLVLKRSEFSINKFLKSHSLVPNVSKKFERFREEFFHVSRESYCGYDSLKDADTIYDAFIAGSDMVWSDIGYNLDAYFLKFTEENKRLSYAPSLTGVDFNNQQKIDYLRDSINGINALSCREKYGVDAIKKITGRDAFLAIDPTLLLTSEEWRSALSIKKSTEKYILCYMFDGVPGKQKKQLEKIAKNEGLTIRYIPMKPSEFVNELESGYSAAYGPKEFVELFSNASFVVTNSFHGLLFSIIFEKPFVLYHRPVSNKWGIHEDRMSSVLELTGLSDRFLYLDTIIDSSYLKLNYSTASKMILLERERSLEYLKNTVDAIIEESHEMSREYHRVDDLSKKECTGCMSCACSCPKQCITYMPDSEGFLYPVVDDGRCIKCGLCVKKCPALVQNLFNYPLYTYLGYGKDSIVEKSASGGIFVSVAKFLMEESNAVVFGAAYNGEFDRIEHVSVRNVADLPKLQNSKYVQSYIGNTYMECKTYLESGRSVLYSGTPCQIAGLKTFLGKNYDLLYTIDIICHGVPSPDFYSKWMEEIKKEHGSGIKEFAFRHKDKKEFRSMFETKITYDDKVIYEPNVISPYYALFSSEDTYRESCYSCKYAKEMRISDITIGDCDSWRLYPHFNPEEPKSSIMINTKKGNELWESMKNMIEYQNMDYEKECISNHQLRRPSARKPIRNTIYQDVNSLSWDELKDRYGYKKPKLVKRVAIAAVKLLNKG